MEGPEDTQKVDGYIRKFLQTQRKLMEVDGRSCGRTENGRKMMEGPVDTRKRDAS